VDAVVKNHVRVLINLNLAECFMSSDGNLVNIIYFINKIEKLTISLEHNFELSLSDMEVIGSLPRLKRLEIIGIIALGAVSALVRCRELIHLKILWQEGMIEVLRVVGRKFICLGIDMSEC
jgi:hypothetical protein